MKLIKFAPVPLIIIAIAVAVLRPSRAEQREQQFRHEVVVMHATEKGHAGVGGYQVDGIFVDVSSSSPGAIAFPQQDYIGTAPLTNIATAIAMLKDEGYTPEFMSFGEYIFVKRVPR